MFKLDFGKRKKSEPTADGVAREIEGLRAARAKALGEMEALLPRRKALLLADDDAGVDEIDHTENEALRTIEKIDLVLPGLELQLASLLIAVRHSRVAFHRAKLEETFEALASAMVAAVQANEAALAAYAAAEGEVGAVSSVIQRVNFPLPGFNRETVEGWATYVRRDLGALSRPNSAYAVRFERSFPPYGPGAVVMLPADAAWALITAGDAVWDGKHAPPPPVVPRPLEYPLPIIPHGDSTHGVRLYETPTPPGKVSS